MPCMTGDDAQFQLTFVQFMPTGAYWTCALCRRTYGPLAYEEGRLLSTKEITLNEAWDVIGETGQQKLIGMKAREAQPFRLVE